MGEPVHKLLCIGLRQEVISILNNLSASPQLVQITNKGDLDKSYENWQDGMFSLILCDDQIDEAKAPELAQLTKTLCPETPRFFVTYELQNVQRSALLKNGIDGIFWLPADFKVFQSVIEEKLSGHAEIIFRPVKLIDIDSATNLEFDTYVYLPLNKKHIKFSAADSGIGEERLQRLSEHKVGTLQINVKDMDRFYSYAGSRLRDLSKSGNSLSETERTKKLQDSVRSIVFEIYDSTEGPDFSEARNFMKSCQGVVSNFITGGASNNWYERVMQSIGESHDSYSHASNVSTFAALFAIALNYPNPEDLALAGLFHDIGALETLQDSHHPKPDQLSNEEREKVFNHMINGINTLKSKRLIINSKVEQAILQYHECFNGRGYPKGLLGERICQEAQLLSFADQFDGLTTIVPGQRRVLPLEAVELISSNGSISPSLLRQLRQIFENKSSE